MRATAGRGSGCACTAHALITAQLNAFRSNEHAAFMSLDKEVELTMGKKERAIGALRQHKGEHKGEHQKSA
jgi:hypothetical protein